MTLRDRIEQLLFEHRKWVIGIFIAATLFMGYSARNIHIDAGFSKLLPLEHEYMQTFVDHREEFGGANRILIALVAKDGDIFTPEFFDTLRRSTDEVFFIPGVDRPRVQSIFTPNVRFTEVVEDGISGGNVVPDDYQPTPEGLAQVRENILKAGIVGRLVSNDFTGALISAQLLEIDPNTGEPLDYFSVANELEEKIRDVNNAEGVADTHIIGFAKVIGDITEGAGRVAIFFAITLLFTTLAVYIFTRSFRLTLITLSCSVTAVVWQIGLLTLLGYGIDPMGILVPFLIFAIGVSHGVQMVSTVRAEVFEGAKGQAAARTAFRRLLIPGGIALLSDTIGFISILFIKIQVIQEMAITASMGVAVIILTNLILLPVLLSYVTFTDRYWARLARQARSFAPFWNTVVRVTEPRKALVILVVSLALLVFGVLKARDVAIGDLRLGVPELRPDSRYNVDSRAITEKFSIGVDIISVIVESEAEGCIDHEVMSTMDDFSWHMSNVEGVQSIIGLPRIAKVINSGWNEGSLKWRVLPRNSSVLTQSVAYVPTDSGLLNEDCSVMPLMIFTTDHKAKTIERVVSEVKQFRDERGSEKVRFRLATGNVGVMAATNEEVDANQFPILLGVFSAVILLCLITFRSIRAVLCVILPLGLVSLLAYALMSVLGIGLKVSTLPVVALGVGIGVDYGIYIYTRFKEFRDGGEPLQEAFRKTLVITGNGVVFTGLTLAIGTGTWIFSPLQFQADMGTLLTFMFLVNMLGAIILLPALAAWLLPGESRKG
ncbi:MAG: RND family transporter [Acidobacteria bacterium]|uniref:RND family transporter n=1 Tax=Candidatus Polarisedimenticola svalbardensis TaxID=2886004 RepID=A0A8J6Y1C9_9BACT|nr:RND family transporter [Candidatus Polarisedimenticola svalbardensis]